MRKKTFITISLWIIIAICWTLVFALRYTKQTVFVYTPNLESCPDIKILDANNPYFQVTYEPNRIFTEWKETNIFLKESKCRVKKPKGKHIYITAVLNNNKYPLIIDTGFGECLVVNDLTVTDNNLGIFPFKTGNPALAGLCHIDKLQIGDMTITNPQSYYYLSHYKKKLFGITTFKQRKIILGLGIMRQFRYVLIDNIDSILEFSMDSFHAEPVESWRQYEMLIENDSQNTTRLMVKIPIAGENTKIAFDTGYDCCLIMTEKIWERYAIKLHKVKEKKNRSLLTSGVYDIREITIDKLSIGNKIFPNESIHIFSDNTIYGPDFFMLGINCFKNTVIVLDFEHNLLWVKQTTDLAVNNENNS